MTNLVSHPSIRLQYRAICCLTTKQPASCPWTRSCNSSTPNKALEATMHVQR
ncbi:unnamed protein product [Acanthoscelides obtectus]|uniref:Uncharacterized protein n=1 Tax=Acanthoscelides obtectus TaxID=200917 RepID=A0A9P0L840_ACAOB|nr:unnamed protein product [Acanthoscelides obtectus]CAK1639284.1 hypothetical protein AOBTE_LOCUS11098 [Acanthoscelides obtectus]